MLQKIRSKIAIFLLTLTPLFFATGCDDKGNFSLEETVKVIMKFLGMLGLDLNPEDAKIPDVPVYDGDETSQTYLSLEDKFPAIGNQGSYGTCVTWATGYALKSALDGTPTNPASPVDLWHSIDVNSKSKKCEGTNFDPAFKALMDKGVASMSQVPFTNNKMTCDGVSGTGGSNKLKSYRIVAYTEELSGSTSQGMTAQNLKNYLASHGAIVIGARLGDKFMNWNSNGVFSSDTYGYTGQHAYHAMVLVGYDDDRGARGAFRVRNSWGPDWGDNGSIWIDYNFFVNNFCFGAWIASNTETSLRSSSVADVEAEVFGDYETSDGIRTVEYDIKNSGAQTISSNENWSAVYLLFRKNRLSEEYLLFHDYYGNTAQKGEISSYPDGVAVHSSRNAITNIDISSGSSAAEKLGGTRLTFDYSIPLDKNGNKLNGDFYMVLIADAFGNIEESDEENNFHFLVGKNGDAIKIVDGKITNLSMQFKDIRTLVSENEPNNYSGVEIQKILQRQMKNGSLKKLVQEKESALRSGTIAKQVK